LRVLLENLNLVLFFSANFFGLTKADAIACRGDRNITLRLKDGEAVRASPNCYKKRKVSTFAGF